MGLDSDACYKDSWSCLDVLLQDYFTERNRYTVTSEPAEEEPAATSAQCVPAEYVKVASLAGSNHLVQQNQLQV